MKVIVGLAVFFTLLIGPYYLVWQWLNPTGFWQRIIFLALSFTPEFFVMILAASIALAIMD